MLRSHRVPQLLAAVSFSIAPMAVAVGQSSVTISPYLSHVPSASRNPFVGLALTFGSGLALRGSADMSVQNLDSISTGGDRPWSADADAVLFLGGGTGYRRTIAPYLFAGLGITGGGDNRGDVVRNGWSYGAGAAIPIASVLDLFGEGRWRMSEYVLPTAELAPQPRSEFRFGLSFHVGGT